jgi:hypothetical protein
MVRYVDTCGQRGNNHEAERRQSRGREEGSWEMIWRREGGTSQRDFFCSCGDDCCLSARIFLSLLQFFLVVPNTISRS